MQAKPMDKVLEKVAAICPAAVQNGKVDFDRLREELSDVVDESVKEAYDFTWVGKRKAIVEANKPINKTLRPCKEESKNWDTTENLYIEGDNLEVLKLLQESYLGKVKMIYIDPPYNTGKDFVYRDNFTKKKAAYELDLGTEDEEGNKLFRNTETNGRFHSDWCTMMYPRLKLARDFLTDDGVIFISIDDNEVANLRKICDNEIFGEENFIVQFPRVTKKGGKSSETTAKNHDYILMYAKKMECVDLKGVSHNDDGYSNKDEYFEERGYYKLNQTLDYDSLGYVPTLDYPIEIDGEVFYAGGDEKIYRERQQGQHGRADWGWRWRWSKDLFAYGLKNGFIEVKKGGNRPRIYTKTYQNVKIESINGSYKIVQIDRTKPLSTLEFTENEYSNDNATKCISELIGKGVFEYTKPPVLVKKMMTLVNSNDFIVMDFFSGSATTAHAVMQLNAEDGGNRKFIMVQLPEETDEKSEAFKAGYKSICEIGKERIRRAGEKVKADAGLAAQNLDVGFRVLKLDESNMQDVYYNPSDIKQANLLAQVDNIKPDRKPLDLLYQVMIDWGVCLSLPLKEERVDANTIHIVGDNDLVACFDANVSAKTVQKMAELKPTRAVFRDSGFGKDDAKINMMETFKAICGWDNKQVNDNVKVI